MPLFRRFPWTVVPAMTALVFAAFAGYVGLSDAMWFNRNSEFYTDYSGPRIYDYFAIAKFAVPLLFQWFCVVFLLEAVTQYTACRVSGNTPQARVPVAFLLPLLNAYLFAQFMQWLEKSNWSLTILLYFTPLLTIDFLVRMAFLAYGKWKTRSPRLSPRAHL